MSVVPLELTALPRPRPQNPLRQDWAVTAVLWRRDLMRFLRQPSRLVGALGQPIIFWFVLGSGLAQTFRLPGSSIGYMEYFYPGVILMVVVFASIFATVSVIEDRHQGFLLPVLVAPGSRAALVFGKCLGAASVASLQAVLFLALAPAAGFALTRIDWPLLAAVLALTSLGLTALGFALAWALDNLQAYHAIQMTFLLPLWVISGAMFPARQPAFRAVARFNPLSYAVAGTREALYGDRLPAGLAGETLGGPWVCLGVLGSLQRGLSLGGGGRLPAESVTGWRPWLLAAGFSLLMLFGAVTWFFRPRARPPPILYPLPAFELVDEGGHPLGSAQLRGVPWVADFIYVSCTDSCPLLTARMGELQEWVQRSSSPLRLVSFTVDPDHDDSARLLDYSRKANADPTRWSFVTGHPERVVELLHEGFKVSVWRDADKGAGGALKSDEVVHDGHLVLVDGEGRIRGYYEASAEGLRQLEAAASALGSR